MVSFADELGNGRPVDHTSTQKESSATYFQETHPQFNHLKLLVVHVSGRPLKNSTYIQKLLPSSTILGDRERGHSTILLSGNGNNIVFKGKIDPTNPSLIDVATFLTALYTSGAKYNVVATAQSTLTGLIQIPGVPSIGNHPIIKRVLKGVYNNRPPKAKYHYIWDTSIVMDYLGLQITDAIGFKALTLTAATLLTILSGQHVSTVHKFKLSGLHFTDNTAIFSIVSDILKHSKPHTLAQYIHARQTQLADLQFDKLFITHQKPFHPASKDSIARWIKELLTLAGINTDLFIPHSCRAAAASHAESLNFPISQILKAG